MDNLLIVAAVIVVIIVIAALLPGWIRRGARSAGSKTDSRRRDAELDAILAELGTTIVIHGTEAAAREIVDLVVLQQPRKFSILDDGTYGIRFIDGDDAVVQLVTDDNGTRVEVQRFSEYLGRPNTHAFWAEFRSRIDSGARARNLTTAPGAPVHHLRAAHGTLWTLDA